MSVIDYRSGVDERADRIGLRWILWAIYLAMSWTWCIGMFLPVLLVQDFGIWGWVVFAIPNVVGAAAMGWTLSVPRSVEIVREYRTAISVFSAVTIAFQLYFFIWLLDWSPRWRATLLVIIALTVAVLSIRASSYLWLPVLVFAASLMFAALGQSGFQDGIIDVAKYTGRTILHWPPLEPKRPGLLPLGLSCVFGFALCPYLDPTFHAARQALSNGQSKLAFSTGFGFFFLLMILFSLQYAIESDWRWQSGGWDWLGTPWISTYMAIQLTFTIGAHAGAVGRRGIIVAVAGISVAILASSARRYWAEERLYRLFMSFYGLFFPAYVWLCMIPGRGRVKPNARQIIVWAIACMIAAPMYWMGFIEGKMIWLLPGLGVVLIARLLIPRQTIHPKPES